jgi:uncharacterized protein (TIGR02271 family)
VRTPRARFVGMRGKRGEEQQIERVPVIAEHAHVEKVERTLGRVRVHKRVVRSAESVDVDLARDVVAVERIPRDVELASPPQVREEGDTVVIPVVEEVVVKRYRVVEEIRVTKRRTTEHRRVDVTLAREEPEIEIAEARTSTAP